jgi:chemotaxis protein methyltransferase CheR
LKHAKNGVYRKAQIDQIPPDYRSALVLGSAEISAWMKVKDTLKQTVTFQQFNLTTPRYPWEEKFDLVLCRNVLIYFPKEVIAQVIQGIYGTTVPGGNLFIGHSESIQNSEHSWRHVRPSVLLKDGG